MPATHQASLDELVTAEESDTYRRDGVVCLRHRFDHDWIDLLAEGIDANFHHPSPLFADNPSPDGKGHYWEDTWVWKRFPQFERFIRESPAAGMAAALMAARRVNYIMDVWLAREAGTIARAPWHHDISYLDLEGTLCTLWVPLDRVDKTSCVSFVRGSHLWNKLFLRVWFVNHQVDGEPGWVNGHYYEPPPDIDNHPEDYDIVSFDMEPGDCLIFDLRTVHGFPKDVLPTRTVRRFTLRMAAEDGVFRHRGDWAKREREVIEAAGHREGDALCSEFFPTLWEAGKL